MIPQNLSGLHALVTGGTQGIGLAIARALASQGACVSLVGRRETCVQRAVATLRDEMPDASVFGCVMDVTDPESVHLGFTWARQQFGEISILINNAGQAETARFTKTDLGIWNRMLAVNLTGTFLCASAAIPDMVNQGWGRIVNIASTAAIKAYPYVSAYSAAKHGVIGLTRSMALEYAQTQITVNAVCPGFTDTDLVDKNIDTIAQKTGLSHTELKHRLAQHNPQARILAPAEVASTVLWLCQPSSYAMNGQSIAVAGGEVM